MRNGTALPWDYLSFPRAGSSFAPAQATAKLQAIVNLRSDVDAAKALATPN
jgi:hypothetical protein